MDRILLVDDERDIVDLLEDVLKKDGNFNIRKAYSGQEALNIKQTFRPDVVVLDIMLPDIDGVEICKRIRAFSHCSILFLTCKSETIDKILGLSSGGDDYVTKPFSPKEVVYRIKSQLRRMHFDQTDASKAKKRLLENYDIVIDTEASIAYKSGIMLELTAKEYGLLKFFMENPNKIISKERLYERVWGEDSVICNNTIMVHIRHLREKIEEIPSVPQILITIKGLGYKMVGEKKA